MTKIKDGGVQGRMLPFVESLKGGPGSEMKIHVMSSDGMSLAAEAWRLSRDVNKLIEWQDIYTVDSPCNEMPSAFCHFHNFTILEREIFASSRTHVMWARTSFVDSPEKYTVPADLIQHVDILAHSEMKRKMQEGKDSGQHQDEWRRFLPVSAMTSFTMRISYRDAIKFAKYFLYLSSVADESLQQRFFSIYMELKLLATHFTGSYAMTTKAMELMSCSNFLHEGDVSLTAVKNLNGAATDLGAVMVSTFTVPFWIRAHFVRHRPITIADDLFQVLKRHDVLDLMISHPVTMQVAASSEIWRSLLGKRSCWLTQSTLSRERDPWQEILDQFGKHVLPCAGGECPYHRDARNRIEGTDPGCPCPRYLKLNDIDAKPFLPRIDQALRSRAEYWQDEVVR
jgi:hypothetical protein